MKKFLAVIVIFATLVFIAIPVRADSLSINFEPTTYSLGSINGQDGWTALGSAGSGCAVYDEGVDSSLGTVGFGLQSFRISDAVTSGCFGDQAFSKPLVNGVGETTATTGGFSVGTLQTHFEMQFDIASVLQTLQPGMHVSVSPDRGDGSRMSYLRFEDQSDGIHEFFDDVTDTEPVGTVATFNESDIATLTRTPHRVKLTMDVVNGPSNDVVKVYIDGTLVKTGKSWEDYYRYDPEASTDQFPRVVRTVLFRESGTADLANAGNGFLIDNLSLSSVNPVAVSVPSITTPANNAVVTSANLVKVDWTDSTGTFSPFIYQYEAYSDSNYTSVVYSSGWLSSSEIPTPGTPGGVYYLRVRAQDSDGNMSDWSNGALNPYKITVDNTAPSITFSGFRDQNSSTYDNTQAIRTCGSVNTSGYIAWEWLLNNTEVNPVNYHYVIVSGPTAVGYSTDVSVTHYNGPIPMVGTYVVQVTPTDSAGNVGTTQSCSVTYKLPVVLTTPTNMDQCKNNGWKTFNNPVFKNQGDCVSFVQSSPNAKGNKK